MSIRTIRETPSRIVSVMATADNAYEWEDKHFQKMERLGLALPIETFGIGVKYVALSLLMTN